MTLSFHYFNILAFLVCIVSNMILGALWYSPVLFGKVWLNLIGKKPEDIEAGIHDRDRVLYEDEPAPRTHSLLQENGLPTFGHCFLHRS